MMQKDQYRLNIIKSYIFKFLVSFYFVSGVIVPFLTVWGGISFFQVMVLQAIYTASIFVLEVPTGVIADRFGRKFSLIFGALFNAAAALVYSSYPIFWLFIIAEILWATGFSFISGADQALVYDSLKKMRISKQSKKIFGIFNSSGLLSLMIAAPIGSLIAEHFGLRYAMMFFVFPSFIAAFIGLSFKEPKITKREKRRGGCIQILKKGIIHFKNNKILKIMAFDYMTICVLASFLLWIYQAVLQDINLPILYFGFVYSAISISEIIVLSNLSRLERLFGGKNKYLIISSILTGLFFILMGLTKNVYITIISIIFIAAFGLTKKPLFHVYMNKFITSYTRATVLSTVSMLGSLSAMILNLVWGIMVDWNLKITLIIIGSLIILFTLFSRVKEEHLLD